jgi:myo-inositol-1(or 4)-monophosphatase
MHPMLNTAVKAARKAGNIILRYTRDLDRLTIEQKTSHHDLVTEVDRAADQAILDVLGEAYPDHQFLTEESGLSSGNLPSSRHSEYQWIIDPLDGTTNFIHGLPHYAVSIALAHRGVIQQAVVFQPELNLLFTATRGSGAYLDDRRIRVSKRTQLRDSLIATTFGYRARSSLNFFESLQHTLYTEASAIRHTGSTALDLAYCATGWYDGTIQLGPRSWDMAAGSLLIQEAGGMIADLNGGADFIDSGHLIAAAPKLFPNFFQIVQTHLNNATSPSAAEILSSFRQ